MPAEPGRVLLVGAGPGPADLMTLRAARAVETAQALLYDALVDETVLAMAPAACLRIQTGKRAGKTSMKQETINRLMLRLARRGLTVVRLKGGDPSVFGRVGEERAFLEGRGIAVETIPGVTAASAAAAQFGFPLTHRGEARRVVFTTARVQAGALALDWRAAADVEATLAIYMGRDRAGELAARMIEAGRPGSTPVAVVESAGSPRARLESGLLKDLGALAARLGDGPVVFIVGEVARQAAVSVAAAPVQQCEVA